MDRKTNPSHKQLQEGRPSPAERGLAPHRPRATHQRTTRSRAGSACPPLWDRPAEWREWRQWALSREGNRSRFYRDSGGLVTIGIGHLVDSGSGIRATRIRAGRRFSARHHSLFRNSSGGPVTPAQVYADWLAVLDLVRPNGLLRLRPGAGDALLEEEMRGYARSMYRVRPFASCLPPQIQMAILDVRFNPGSTNPFLSSRVRPLWNALDRRRSLANRQSLDDDYDPRRALELFRSLWQHAPRSRYQQRHDWRIQQFEAGVAQMLAEDQNRFSSLIENLSHGR